jgi:AbrB family transcriptional regulator (stage V sporulation protein T)
MYENASQVTEIVARLTECPTIVFDRDHVVAVSGIPKKEYLERRVSHALEELMESRRQYFSNGESVLMPVEGVDRSAVACVPIVSSSDVTGAIALLQTQKTPVTELQKSLAIAGAQFLGKMLE